MAAKELTRSYHARESVWKGSGKKWKRVIVGLCRDLKGSNEVSSVTKTYHLPCDCLGVA